MVSHATRRTSASSSLPPQKSAALLPHRLSRHKNPPHFSCLLIVSPATKIPWQEQSQTDERVTDFNALPVRQILVVYHK